MNKIILSYILSAFVWGSFTTQPNAETTNIDEILLSVTQLKEDFKVFRTSLEEIHPALYLFISKDSLDYYFNEAEAKLNTPMTKEDFLRIINPIILKIYDEHTSINVTYKYNSLQKLMPVKVRWVDGKPYIFKNLLNDPAIILGSEIISINGKSIQDLYRDMKRYYPCTGYTDPALEYDAFSLHFDYIYASFFEQPDSFKIEAIHPETNTAYIHTVPAVLTSDMLHYIPVTKMTNEYCNKDSAYKFKIEDDIAVMTITGFNEFDWKGTHIDFYSRLRQDFKSIKNQNIKNLVIDLRYCLGGEAYYAAELCSYLYNKPFQLFDTLYTSINQIPTYAAYTNWREHHWERQITQLTQLHKKEKIKNDWTTSRDVLFLPKKDQFKGNIYVLINSDCHSAASVAAALMKHYTKPIFIGVPVGGPYNGGSAMETLTLTLPNTKLEVYIPLVRYLHSMPNNKFPYKNNLAPDVIIKPTIQDLLNNKDVVWDSAKTIIKKNEKPPR